VAQVSAGLSMLKESQKMLMSDDVPHRVYCKPDVSLQQAYPVVGKGRWSSFHSHEEGTMSW
jgi:hypothetical protein